MQFADAGASGSGKQFLRMVYRFRPLTVDTCLHEILVLDPVPENGSRPAPVAVVRLEDEDSYETVAGFDFAQVFDQDTDNLRNQRGGHEGVP